MSNFQPDPTAGLDATQLAVLEDKNRERIAGWFDLAGIEAAYPVASDTVVKLLRAIEYLCDNDTLLAYLNDEIIPPVPRQNGRLVWSATNVVSLAAALEARRKWQPFSTLHAVKFSMIERLQHIYDAQGGSAFSDLAAFDIDALLGLLHQAGGDRGAVAVLAEALREKLKGAGVL